MRGCLFIAGNALPVRELPEAGLYKTGIREKERDYMFRSEGVWTKQASPDSRA